MRKPVLLLLVALTAAAMPSNDWAAQQAPGAHARLPAWVAISPELEGTGTPFRLARFAGNAPRDVILLAPDADAGTLTQAVHALLAARRAGGDQPEADALLQVRQRRQGPRVLPWAGRVLQDAHNAAPRQIPGVGRVRAVQIWLPSQQRRA